MKNEKILVDLFEAYFSARRNKRNKNSSLYFERNFEVEIFKIFDEIISRSYVPKTSICFTVEKPVQREIFAANFSDRVVHHFVYNYISPVFEKRFINDSYSCRKGKGVHYGINRVERFLRSCSENYKEDCYILKLDIKSYFMSIRKDLLFSITKEALLKEQRLSFDVGLVLYLLKQIIFDNPEKNCFVREWKELPLGKSLFDTEPNCGLPIGNLTSQLFGNVYLDGFDHFVKQELGIKYYGRYVDDVIILHEDKEYLKSIVPKIREYLRENLSLTLHPDKIYLQHFSKGVKFLGTMIKPYRRYIANSTKGSLYAYLKGNSRGQGQGYFSGVNSYLGILRHCSTYSLRKKILTGCGDNICKNFEKIF
jgi:RNA-directed DNA polymerase